MAAMRCKTNRPLLADNSPPQFAGLMQKKRDAAASHLISAFDFGKPTIS
jgi:hypothetical protein